MTTDLDTATTHAQPPPRRPSSHAAVKEWATQRIEAKPDTVTINGLLGEFIEEFGELNSTAAQLALTAITDAFNVLMRETAKTEEDAFWAEVEAHAPPAPSGKHLAATYNSILRPIAQRLWSEKLGETEPTEPPALEHLSDGDIEVPKEIVPPLLRDDGLTTFFGPGGAGKSTIGAAVAVAAATSRHLSALTRNGERRPVIVLPYESRKGLKRRLRGFAQDADTGLIRPVNDTLIAGAIWDDAIQLRDLIRAEYAEHGGPEGILLIDSVSVAIGGLNPSDAEAATQFARAVETIGLPAIAIAHQNRAGDASMPFGSVFWHNLSRMTWHVGREESSGTMTLTCKKDNEGEMVGQRRAFDVAYDEDHTLPVDIVEAQATRDTLASSILSQLVLEGAMTANDLATALHSDAVVIRTTVRRHRDLFNVSDGRPALISAKVLPRE